MDVSTILGARGFLLIALLIWVVLVAMSIVAANADQADNPPKRRRARLRSSSQRRSLNRIRSPRLGSRERSEVSPSVTDEPALSAAP